VPRCDAGHSMVRRGEGVLISVCVRTQARPQPGSRGSVERLGSLPLLE
jgi:hypothetical protein